jgi:mRNA interferase MazF
MRRDEIWRADLPEPAASEPGYRRPVLIVSADDFNASRIQTILAVALSTNLRLSFAPGNVLVPAVDSGLTRESVINVSQLLTVDKSWLNQRVG